MKRSPPNDTPVTTSHTFPFKSCNILKWSAFEIGFSSSSCLVPNSISNVVDGSAWVKTTVSAIRDV